MPSMQVGVLFELLSLIIIVIMATITVVMKMENAIRLDVTCNFSEEIIFLLGDTLECENFASGVAHQMTVLGIPTLIWNMCATSLRDSSWLLCS